MRMSAERQERCSREQMEMNEIKCAFVTGGTGLLGINIVRELIAKTKATVVLLVRRLTPEKRRKFFKDLLNFGGGLWPFGFTFQRIKFVEGDITLPHLGISPGFRSRLYRKIDIIYHSAAVIKLMGAEAEVRAANVEGTRNLLDFSMKCKEKGRLDRVVHVSTVGVAGDYEGVFKETDLDVGQGFNNPYEKSKFDAEKVVEEYRKKGLNILIVRPSMVIGDSQTGYTNHFNIFYFQLKLLSQGVFDTFFLRDDATYNIISADYAARAVFLVACAEDAINKNFHIISPYEVRISELIETSCSYLAYRKPVMVPINAEKSFSTQDVGGVRSMTYNIFYPYISKKKIFDASQTERVLRSQGFVWPRIEGPLYTKMLDGCVFSGYLPLKASCPHEEALKSKEGFEVEEACAYLT